MIKIEQMVTEALREAETFADAEKDEPSPRNAHAARSREFVKLLARQFEQRYRSECDIKVLSGSIDRWRLKLGMNELLFDITVCRTDETEAAFRDTTLTYITESLWAVESEFARNSRSTIYDFNKLLLSNAENKLFICSQVPDEESFLRPIWKAARHCSGKLHVATVPHPSQWSMDSPGLPHFWDMKGDGPKAINN